jgi:alkylhydroperoxidase/carboxymuconolactone decarboxylase family protein YurZ
MTEQDKKELKEKIGYVPPGIILSDYFGETFQNRIMEYHKDIWGEGVIPLKYRYLIALATAIVDHNETRAKFELIKALKHGANREEVLEVFKQQIWMKGTPTVVQMAPLFKLLDEKTKGCE